MHMVQKNIILKQHGQLSCFQLSGIVSLLHCLRKLHYLAVVKRIKGFYLNQNYFQIIHNAMSIDTNIVFTQQEKQQLKSGQEKEEDELKLKHSQEKKRLPRRLRNDSKTRLQMYRKSIHIKKEKITVEEEKEMLKTVR